MGRQVYENLKVLDVTNTYAGPMAGAMLADYGAEVWHVEKPALGEQNHEVLEALGFTAEEVDEMEAEWEMKVKNK